VVLYFAAIIAPLMPREPSLGTVIAIVVAIVMSAIVGFGALATLISTNRLRSKFLKAGPYIDFVAGIFFLIAGCGLVIAGALDLTGITG
jgi:threonine efflux protein